MTVALVDPSIHAQKERLSDYAHRLHGILAQLDLKQLQPDLENIQRGINKPFLFVILGEVNAGKSSLVNTLLEDEICPTDVSPCTDVIQEIVHADYKTTIEKSEFEREIGLPIDILKEISIVDTPGTNSILEHHQRITEGYIPQSDLVIFVLFAKNPYTKSAWDLFSLIRQDWKKKAVFVLQQADLCSDDEIATHSENVAKEAVERGADDPKVFAVSAREGRGISELRDFVLDHVTGGRAWELKAESIRNSLAVVNDQVDTFLKAQMDMLRADQEREQEIRQLLNPDRSDSEIDHLIQRIIQRYRTISEDFRRKIERGLGMWPIVKRSFVGMVQRDESLRNWAERVTKAYEKDLLKVVEDNSLEYATDFITDLKKTCRGIVGKLEDSMQEIGQAQGFDWNDKLSTDREQILAKVIKRIEEYFDSEEYLKAIDSTQVDAIPSSLGKGGALAIIGVVIMYATQVVWLDYTGGVLTAVGVLGSIAYATFKRHAVMAGLALQIQEGEYTLRRRLQSDLSDRLTGIYQGIERELLPFFQNVAARAARLEPVSEEFDKLKASFSANEASEPESDSTGEAE